MSPLIVVLEAEAYPDAALSRLHSLGTVRAVRGASPTGVSSYDFSRYQDAWALFVGLGMRVDRSAMDHMPGLEWIVTPTTGVDHIDTREAAARGMSIVSLWDGRDKIRNIFATAEHTWALLLCLMRHVHVAFNDVNGGRWRRNIFLGTELSGRTIGIVGCGRIGGRVAQFAKAFDMDVACHDLHSDEDCPLSAADLHHIADPGELISRSEILSLHLPLTVTTEGWLSRERIELLPHGAIVVNTARGGLVDELALAEAVREGRLGGIALDVVGNDATWSDTVGESPVLAAMRDGYPVLATPHIGGWARDAVRNTRELAVELFENQVMRDGAATSSR